MSDAHTSSNCDLRACTEFLTFVFCTRICMATLRWIMLLAGVCSVMSNFCVPCLRLRVRTKSTHYLYQYRRLEQVFILFLLFCVTDEKIIPHDSLFSECTIHSVFVISPILLVHTFDPIRADPFCVFATHDTLRRIRKSQRLEVPDDLRRCKGHGRRVFGSHTLHNSSRNTSSSWGNHFARRS